MAETRVGQVVGERDHVPQTARYAPVHVESFHSGFRRAGVSQDLPKYSKLPAAVK